MGGGRASFRTMMDGDWYQLQYYQIKFLISLEYSLSHKSDPLNHYLHGKASEIEMDCCVGFLYALLI